MSSHYLPPELLINVLTRLPVRSLLRCTSVCKSWYSLITSPSFIAIHLNRNNQSRLLMVRQYHIGMSADNWTEQYTLYCDNDTFDEFTKFDFPFSKGKRYFILVGICNGLICLSGDQGTNTSIITLWNPSIRKSITLPKPNVPCKSPGRLWHCLGFGIDPVTADYKIIRLAYHFYDWRLLVPPDVELFKLSSGSWRNIDVGDFPCVTFLHDQQAVLNGVIHWTGSIWNKDSGSRCFVIVSFDMRNDSLGVIKAPSCGAPNLSQNIVTVFGESLSLLHPHGGHSWCIWVMMEYGIESSWTKLFTIDFGCIPICFRENGDIILERRTATCERELISYNFESKLIKNLIIQGTSCSFDVDAYKESLVLANLSAKGDFGCKKSIP
ncbi:hypothetical protein LguiA_022111 [Lonicera macranthoides]